MRCDVNEFNRTRADDGGDGPPLPDFLDRKPITTIPLVVSGDVEVRRD